MIKIDLLKNHPQAIPDLTTIWYEVLGKIWVPDISAEHMITRFTDHFCGFGWSDTHWHVFFT
jgi:hypothetical protein